MALGLILIMGFWGGLAMLWLLWRCLQILLTLREMNGEIRTIRQEIEVFGNRRRRTEAEQERLEKERADWEASHRADLKRVKSQS